MADRLSWWFFLVAACVKILLFPSYHSTDFEVHRHWLALTSSLPLSKWYSDESSQWTLDYPPLFAHLERLLSLPASLVDPTIVSLSAGQNYSAPSAVLFQRSSVVLADLSLLLAARRVLARSKERKTLTLILLIWSPALLIVDHVHFQYNGFLLGILIMSLALLAEGRDLAGGFVFAVLLCTKHLFMVAAPVYFAYLLRHYCCAGGVGKGIARLVAMGGAVLAVFTAAFGPFVYYGQIQQVLRRLFPFGRGLCHAYWAPNFWVFYIMLDKGLAFVLGKLGYSMEPPKASFTGGLVGDSSPFAVLPQVTPAITFLLVLLAMSPSIVKAFLKPQPKFIVRWVAYAYTCGFMFGWHVHEKASLHFTIPLGIIAMDSLDDARHYFLLSIVSCYSMFPLLFEPQEYPIKVLLLAIHTTLMWAGFSSHFSTGTAPEPNKKNGAKDSNKEKGWIGGFELCYLLGIVGVEVWGQFLHPYIFGTRLPFLPLMLVSIYCAFGMMYSWIWQLRQIIRCT